MELSKKHRDALVHQLKNLVQKLEVEKKMLNESSSQDSDHKHLKELNEVSLWMVEQQFHLVQDALINNELKDW